MSAHNICFHGEIRKISVHWSALSTSGKSKRLGPAEDKTQDLLQLTLQGRTL